MIGAIVSDASSQTQLDELRDAARGMATLPWDESELIVADSVCPDLSPVGPPPAKRSLFSLSAEGNLETAALGRRVRAFRDAYGRALVTHVYNSVRPAGYVLLPFHADKGVAAGYWSLPWLEGVLGEPERVDESTRWALFRRSEHRMMPTSVFSWYVRNVHALATDHIRFQSEELTEELERSCREFLVGSVLRRQPQAGGPFGVETEPSPPREQSSIVQLDRFFTMMNYCVSGVSYKTEGLRRVLDGHLGGRRGSRVLDLGSGPGAVLAELLLSRDDVELAMNCEVEAHYVPLARRLFYEYPDRLAGRFRFHQGPAEKYPFDEEFDIICSFAALFLIPRPYLHATLKRAWESLRPGGCLVIHENIKRPCFESQWYYDQMFTREELESVLGEFGPVEVYRSSDLGRIDDDSKVGELTVFRIVQKSGSSRVAM